MINDGVGTRSTTTTWALPLKMWRKIRHQSRGAGRICPCVTAKSPIVAQDAGKFKDEIVAVSIPQPQRRPDCVDTDEYINRKTNAESLAGLRPAFDKAGTVTAGNAPGHQRRCGGGDGDERGQSERTRFDTVGHDHSFCQCKELTPRSWAWDRCTPRAKLWTKPVGRRRI